MKRDRAYLTWIRSLPCAVLTHIPGATRCFGAIEAHHPTAGYDMRDAKTKAAKVKLLGNSVPPEMVEALVAANRPARGRIAA